MAEIEKERKKEREDAYNRIILSGNVRSMLSGTIGVDTAKVILDIEAEAGKQ